MRLLFLILLLANVAAFGYIRYAESRVSADAQLTLLQINPEKLKLLQPGPPPRTDDSRPSLVCLEWGGFSADEAVRAAAALGQFGLGDKLTQRDSTSDYWVYIPPLKTRAEADKKAAEVKVLGIGDFSVVQDNDQWQFAISLGVFKTEEAANDYLAQLRQKGVRSAQVGLRSTPGSLFVIRDPGDAIAGKIAGLKAEFPASTLKAAACTEPVAAKAQ